MVNKDCLKLSVVICTRNRPLHLRNCLESILACRPQPSEIVIVDQSDQPEAERVVDCFRKEYPELVYLRCLRVGKSYGLNLAIRYVRGDFICFTDDDCIVSPDWLGQIEQQIREQDLACITGRVLAQDRTGNGKFLNLVLSEKPKVAARKTNPWKLGCVGCNMAIRKDIFSIVGGFDESLGPGATFKSAEDGDLVYRILKNNRLVVYSPLIKVYHSTWRGPKEDDELRYAYAMGLGSFAAKYLKQGDIYPLFMILKKILHKSRRMCLGCLLLQRERIRDGYLHIKGISQGFFRRLFLYYG
jgi:GT2 family glycosyltransferase